jgi:hypothetical protein
MRTNASFISNNTLLCVAPAYSSTMRSTARVRLRVSLNQYEFSSSAAIFEYTPCPSGAHCPSLQVLPCPRGSLCHTRSGTNMSLCPPGTYQAGIGQTECTLCPVGSFCPADGLPTSILCSPGMVCSLKGLSFPDSMCPPGHFCPPGVSTMDPNAAAHGRRPLECPENVWCPGGVASNVSIPGNFSTPQPCLNGYVCFRGSDSAMGSGPCPSGHYCPPGSLPVECPPASYCPGVGNVFPSLCTPGFYNDQRARDACIECPIGYICPIEGLDLPLICPAGALCAVPGLRYPSGECPPGYFCWEGTETGDANSETVFRPYACPEATYCLGSITNNMTNQLDYNSPQPCPQGQYCKEASTSPFGTGRCPPGFFCPKATSDPFPAPAGYFCSSEGNSMAAPCLPGTWAKYNPINGTDACDNCPGGYSCESEGTYEPLPCPAGAYREFGGTVSCQLCPEGSWNPYYANPLAALCLPCPETRVCALKGMTKREHTERSLPLRLHVQPEYNVQQQV